MQKWQLHKWTTTFLLLSLTHIVNNNNITCPLSLSLSNIRDNDDASCNSIWLSFSQLTNGDLIIFSWKNNFLFGNLLVSLPRWLLKYIYANIPPPPPNSFHEIALVMSLFNHNNVEYHAYTFAWDLSPNANVLCYIF